MPIADVSYCHSEGGYPVCMTLLYRSTGSELIASRSRLARRGGIKRISGNVYDEARDAMVDRLKTVFLHRRIIDIM